MKKTRSSLTERKGIGLKQNQTSSQRKLTPTNPRVMKKNISVNMVNTKSNKEQKAKEKVTEESRDTRSEYIRGGKEDDGINTIAKCRRTREENNRVLTNRQCRRNNKQHTGNDKRRFTNKENVDHREVCSNGRNETKRKRGGNCSDREKQNVWDSFHNKDRN